MDNRSRPAQAALTDAAEAVHQVGQAIPAERIAGIALAVAGLVDDAGLVRLAPNLNHWSDVDAATALDGELRRRRPWSTIPGMRIDVGNEADLAALAELWFGHAGPRTDFLHISGEIGIGAGIVVAGRLFRGSHGFAGEIGHVVVSADGPLCRCGRHGCLEQFAGQEALLRNAGLDPHERGIDDLVGEAEAGSQPALDALDRAGRALGVALTDAVNLLDVTTVVLGGAYGRIGRWLSGPIRDQLDHGLISRGHVDAQILISALGGDAAMVGAAGSVIAGVVADPARLINERSVLGRH